MPNRFFPVILIALLLAACAGGDVTKNLAPVEQHPVGFVEGIDISKYQGDIDWRTVRKAGIRFAFIKATEGGDVVDDRFDENWRAAKAAGVARGAYHFYYFCRTAEDQVKWFIRNVPKDPDALPPVLDMEWNAHSPSCKKRPPRDKVLAEMRVFLEAAERYYGKKPIIYSSVDFHQDILEGALKEYPFWLRSVAGHPSTKYRSRAWVFWQYTGTGEVDGIDGKVDRNVFNGNAAAWKRWLEKQTDDPTPARPPTRP
ncbi:glycoside hydrolase family 25 protein [Rhodobium gokarnense]|uniref:Lysozyme n=1 Tax=Rhodobium gokarnense TaxID=364296 RepID=A0ABT3H8C2_9HYPH|nr:glycoside hydrolase family 25 protein [Rhodobium gokarnense]MCW2306634.1 lysozyme [Rhodobium gokarnense]